MRTQFPPSQGQRAAPSAGRAGHSMGLGKELVFPVTPHLQPQESLGEGQRKAVYRHYLSLNFSKMVSREYPPEAEVDPKN